jgi:hypothetical protein
MGFNSSMGFYTDSDDEGRKIIGGKENKSQSEREKESKRSTLISEAVQHDLRVSDFSKDLLFLSFVSFISPKYCSFSMFFILELDSFVSSFIPTPSTTVHV